MPVSLSEHLIQSYSMNHSFHPYGPARDDENSLIIHGQTSYNSAMHGSHIQPPLDISDDTASKIASLQVKLNQKLGPEYVSQRPGPGGGPKLTYIEGWKVINLANEVFGFNGWSSSVISLTTDFVDYNEETRRYSVGVTAIVRVTLRDGVSHEDIGYGSLENSKSKGAALDKCKKEAVTDGVKRALRGFGNLLGNCLYDKAYAQEIVKMKVPPPKFDQNDLHRRPEFQNSAKTVNTPTTSSKPQPVIPNRAPVSAPRPFIQNPPTASTPSHVSLLPPPINSTTTPIVTPREKGIGLATPRTTPNQQHADVTGQATHPPKKVPQPLPKIPARPVAHSGGTENSPISNIRENRHVLFAEEPSADGADETFSQCFSDDDAFLATVDLADSDMGPPINFEEGVMDKNDHSLDQEVSPAPAHDMRQQNPKLELKPAIKASYAPSFAENLDSQLRAISAAQSSSMTSLHRTTMASPATGADGRPSGSAIQHEKRDAGGENLANSAASGGSRMLLQKRATSNGGFNFPPDMAKQRRPSFNVHSSTASYPTRTIEDVPLAQTGKKRTSETMQMEHMQAKKLTQGMGLAQQQARCETVGSSGEEGMKRPRLGR